MHIIGTDTGNGVRLIAVHIDQCLKTIFLAAVKQPINRAFLIHLAMIFIKIIQEIIPNYIFRLTFAAQSIGNEFQILVQSFCTVDPFHKFYKTTDNIILKIFVVTNWDNVICIRRITSFTPLIFHTYTIVFPQAASSPAAFN